MHPAGEDRATHKSEASTLRDLCQKFREYRDPIMRVRPYLPRAAFQARFDFGLLVKCDHAIWEVGLSRNLFHDPYYYLVQGTYMQAVEQKIKRYEEIRGGQDHRNHRGLIFTQSSKRLGGLRNSPRA